MYCVDPIKFLGMEDSSTIGNYGLILTLFLILKVFGNLS